MLSFNQLLQAGGLDPRDVRLVRHTHPVAHIHRALFDAAMQADENFKQYQETQLAAQVIAQFRAATYLAGFVVEPFTKETVFVGVWKRGDERPPTTGRFEPELKPGLVAFETHPVDAFNGYRGRLMIDWGGGERTWVQRADQQDKPIVELRPGPIELAFPGFSEVRLCLADVERVPARWIDVLRSVRGVYLLVHRTKGDQYVGSASGADGFFGRWKNYADGHGGNVAMKELGAPAEDYDAAILEVVGSDAAESDIIAREELWKVKLGTRVKGLNRN
jgi:hypothetical protein